MSEDLSKLVSDLAAKPLSQWSPVDRAKHTMATAMAHPQKGADGFQRQTETQVVQALINSIADNKIGFGTKRITLSYFNNCMDTQRVAKKTAGDRSPLGTSDVAKAFGTTIEAMTISHTLQAERRSVADQTLRIGGSDASPATVDAATKALRTLDNSLRQAESAFGTLVHNGTIDRQGAQRVLWFAGEAESKLERSGSPFPRGQALIGALATYTADKRAGLEQEAVAQKSLMRTDSQAKGRLFAINATLGSYVIASPALRDARASATQAAAGYLAATRESTDLKFVSGSARQQVNGQPVVKPAKGVGSRVGIAKQTGLSL